jgi:hypothetical protein
MDRSLHGEEQQEDDPATRHEEDSVVSGHTIHSFLRETAGALYRLFRP